MPLTPLHLLPALAVYFVIQKRINLFAFMAGTLLIDIEPLVYSIIVPEFSFSLLDGTSIYLGLHTITHNPCGVLFIVGPVMGWVGLLLQRWRKIASFFLGNSKRGGAKVAYFSAVTGGFLHVGWDVTMHLDINLAFPFFQLGNPFVSDFWLDAVFIASLIALPISLIVGRIITGEFPFEHWFARK
jgi:hypothetical protein